MFTRFHRLLCAALIALLILPTASLAEEAVTASGLGGGLELAMGRLDWASKVVKVDWFDGGNEILAKDAYGYIYDIDTGIVVRIKRMGGHNHMDVEPATAADTEKLLEIAGGKFSWASKSVILIAGGQYVAAAINTKPHGQQTILDNNYRGQFCLHTTNSITHGSHRVNVEHMKAIERAYNWCQWKSVERQVVAFSQAITSL